MKSLLWAIGDSGDVRISVIMEQFVSKFEYNPLLTFSPEDGGGQAVCSGFKSVYLIGLHALLWIYPCTARLECSFRLLKFAHIALRGKHVIIKPFMLRPHNGCGIEGGGQIKGIQEHTIIIVCKISD